MAPLTLSPSQILIFFPTLLVASAAIRIFYNIFLHPLRSYPGPLSARASLAASQLVKLNGRTHLWLHELHKKYGPVVRYAPNEVSFIEPGVWKDVYGHRATSFMKDMRFYGPDIYGHPPGLIRADNISHARQRKLVSHAFSDKALREQEAILKGYVELLVRKLKEAVQKNKDGKVDMVDWYNFTTFDIMADLTFGQPLKLLEGSDYSPWVRSLFDNLKLILIKEMTRTWPGAETLLSAMIPKHLQEKRKTHMMYSVDRVKERLARTTDRPDIWTYVMRHSASEENKGKGLVETEMNSNGALFMLAGTETTATELSGLSYYLLKYPEKMERLKNEVRGAFQTYDDMTMTKLSQLEYLGACIDEGLRIYPPVSLGLPRTAPAGGANVGGQWVPEGTSVSLSMYAAYHSPANFKNPDIFAPERWLPEGEKEYGTDHKEVLQPFSYGPRNCLGKNLAHHEMRLVLASILWNFDMELCAEDTGDWLDQEVYILWKKKPLVVKLKSVRG